MDETDRVVREMAERIRRAIDPERVVLFGSRGRGEGGAESDYDLLIVGASTEPRWRRAALLYGVLAGMGVPKEIVWWTPEEVAEWRGVRSHFINTALREGTVVYEKRA